MSQLTGDQKRVKVLENVARKAGLRIVYGRPRIRSGACVYRGRGFVVIHKDSDAAARARLLADVLAEQELDDTWLESDEVREAIAEARERASG